MRIWLRVKLPERELASLLQEAPKCELRQGDDDTIDPQWLHEVDAVFTEEPLPERLLEQMPKLKWLHVTRGGLSAYLTPLVRARPIQVTGSKGIHGTVFSEFALACILALAKKAAGVYGRTNQTEMAKARAHRGRRQNPRHCRSRHRR